MDLLVGIDLGTSGCKITMINLEGKIIAKASGEYTTYHPKPSFSEQNPSDWFKAMKDCLYEIDCYSGQS